VQEGGDDRDREEGLHFGVRFRRWIGIYRSNRGREWKEKRKRESMVV
jgi:hypothetical protein